MAENEKRDTVLEDTGEMEPVTEPVAPAPRRVIKVNKSCTCA